MSKEKTIAWGTSLIDIDTLKDIDIHVTGIYVDSFGGMVTIITEQGIEVRRTIMSMDDAQEIGFINIQALKPYIK